MNCINSLTQQSNNSPHLPNFPWPEIDKVFFDLDGTLLDRYYDDYFWEEFVPQTYSRSKGVSFENAQQKLLATYKSVESTLSWTDLDYWSQNLDLNIAQLKSDIKHLIQPRPYAIEFLDYVHKLGKNIYLVTNAHPTALQIKMKQVDLTPWFYNQICSKDVGAAKEQIEFWHKFEKMVPFDKETTLFIDDNIKVLSSAREFGINHLVHIAKPSSKAAPQFCDEYRSISSFKDLM